jgi:hypothetical protein
MKVTPIVSLVFFVGTLCGCEQAGYVEKAKYDQLMQESAELKKQLAEQQEQFNKTPHHHYSLHREGFRTFRFDADTGETCVQLTTPEDWKRKDTKAQSCTCSDFLVDGAKAGEIVRKVYCGW